MQEGRSVLWQRLDAPGVEYFRLRKISEGWKLRGAVILYLDPSPFFIQYTLTTDEPWRSCTLHVESEMAGTQRRLQLACDASGAWLRGGEPAPQLVGCTAPDLIFSPSSLVMPIRGLNLPVGATGEIGAAWVTLPDLIVIPMRQRLTRVGERRYRLESRASDSSREIEVDDAGLPLVYSTIWKALS